MLILLAFFMVFSPQDLQAVDNPPNRLMARQVFKIVEQNIKCSNGEVQARKSGAFCNPFTKDVGKSCTDNRQCEGICEVKEKGSKTGSCSKFKMRYGCYGYMSDGKVVRICKD